MALLGHHVLMLPDGAKGRMKFSAWLGSATAWPDLLDEARHVSKSGWDGIWIADHFMPSRGDVLAPVQECWTVLAAFAAAVPNVRLGSLVAGNTYRHPAVLAKEAAQVDVISGGRAVLGIGAGWQENEHVAYGIPFDTVGGRLRRLEESVQILRSLFDNERTDFEGRYYTIRNAPLVPKPVQARLPILVGGGGEKVTMRIAAQYADEWNTWGTPETLRRKRDILDRHCEEVGRDPATIRRSAQVLVAIGDEASIAERRFPAGRWPCIVGSLEEVRSQIARYVDASIDEFILPDFNLGRTVAERKDGYDRFLEEVAGALR
jgi:F420-dependent oxidoreductase-like protein